MKTDIPLKRLTQLCPSDVLSLAGIRNATVLRVESLELPTSKSSLDCVLHMQTADGIPYLHLIEWQGWNDPALLWRAMSYAGWLGQNRPERPILLTIIYLKPGDDVGDSLVQELPEQPGWILRLPCVRLWEQDAKQAVASGLPGLLALSPLLAGATTTLVEEAAKQLIRLPQPTVQADLLTALGVFAEPLLRADRFMQLITKERLMSSDLFQLVYQDKLIELEQQKQDYERLWQQRLAVRDQELAVRDQELAVRDQELAVRDQELAVRDQERELWYQATHHMIEDAFMLRFPTAPVQLLHQMRRIRATPTLQALHYKILSSNDLSSIEQAIAAAVADVA